MIKWQPNERCLKIQFFCWPQQTTSFHLILSFQHHFTLLEMTRDDKFQWRGHHLDDIPFIFSSFQAFSSFKNFWMTVKWGIILNQGKTLNSKISFIPPSFHHSLSKSYSSYDHSNHLRVIQSFNIHSNFEIIPCWR